MRPHFYVMHLTPPGRPITPRISTPPVAGGHSLALSEGDTTSLPTDVEGLAVPTQHHRGDLRLAHQPAQLPRAGLPTEFQGGAAGLILHPFPGDDRGDVWTFPTLSRQIPLVEGMLTNLPQRISLALTQRLVLIRGGFHTRRDRPSQHIKGRSIQLALDPTAATGTGLGQVQLVDQLISIIGGRAVLVELLDPI